MRPGVPVLQVSIHKAVRDVTRDDIEVALAGSSPNDIDTIPIADIGGLICASLAILQLVSQSPQPLIQHPQNRRVSTMPSLGRSQAASQVGPLCASFAGNDAFVLPGRSICERLLL